MRRPRQARNGPTSIVHRQFAAMPAPGAVRLRRRTCMGVQAPMLASGCLNRATTWRDQAAASQRHHGRMPARTWSRHRSPALHRRSASGPPPLPHCPSNRAARGLRRQDTLLLQPAPPSHRCARATGPIPCRRTGATCAAEDRVHLRRPPCWANRRAVARPIPEPAPVTTTLRPAKRLSAPPVTGCP